jgi:hypothetical protein
MVDLVPTLGRNRAFCTRYRRVLAYRCPAIVAENPTASDAAALTAIDPY